MPQKSTQERERRCRDVKKLKKAGRGINLTLRDGQKSEAGQCLCYLMNPEVDLNMHSSKGLILKLVSEESHPVTILQPGVVSVCTLSV